jgi:hypothetical protein
MFRITIRRSVTTLAVMAGLFAVAGPGAASATDVHAVDGRLVTGTIVTDNKDPDVLHGPRSAKWEISEFDA